MAVTVETLEKLERKITLSLPVTLIQTRGGLAPASAWPARVKMDGFRPGKVPVERGGSALWLLGCSTKC